MKKICILFLTFLIIALSVAGVTAQNNAPKTEYLRIHIRADSNDEKDQSVKYLVKNAVVEFLTPYIAQCDTREKAEKTLCDSLKGIEAAANEVLKKNGFSYSASARITTEEFPARVYGGLTLERGFYKALIVNLGSGKGDNWWCVVYPPLCFTGEGAGYVYRSKIYDIIKKFLDNREEK